MSMEPISAVADLATTVINKIWPDKSEQERAQIAMAVSIVNGQIDINKEEAKNSSLLVSGWRPFIGWTCGGGCAWNWIGLPIVKTAGLVAGYKLEVSPADLSEMMPLLVAMLGLGGYRTFEKVSKVAK